MPDLLSIALRALLLLAIFQAAGAFLVRVTSGPWPGDDAALVERLGRGAVLATLCLLLAHQGVEAARLAGDFGGLLDPALQGMAWRTGLARVHGVQAVGALLLWAGFGARRRSRSAVATLGVLLLLGGFTLSGHTRVHPRHVVLAPLLLLHVLGGAYWLGGLLPLYVICGRVPPTRAAALLARFSGIAGLLVPALALAGWVMAWVLTGGRREVLDQPYGWLLAAKFALLLILLLLAARNRWRLTPAMARGAAPATRALRQAIAFELWLIAVVLAITATLTALYSPD